MKENNTVLPKKRDHLVFCQIPPKSTQTFRSYTAKQCYCPRHTGCCGRMEKSFMLSERIWPMRAEYRIAQVLILHPPLPTSTYLYEAPELMHHITLNSFHLHVHTVCGCRSKRFSSTHFHSLCCFFLDAVTTIPSPCPATATLPQINFCFYNSSASLLMAAICNIFFYNIVSFWFIRSFMCFGKP